MFIIWYFKVNKAITRDLEKQKKKPTENPEPKNPKPN